MPTEASKAGETLVTTGSHVVIQDMDTEENHEHYLSVDVSGRTRWHLHTEAIEAGPTETFEVRLQFSTLWRTFSHTSCAVGGQSRELSGLYSSLGRGLHLPPLLLGSLPQPRPQERMAFCRIETCRPQLTLLLLKGLWNSRYANPFIVPTFLVSV